MATFMEPKFPISKEQRAQRKAAANQTLEDVAEEILNGILCQYEPPNRTNNAQSRKLSGILRRPTDRKSKNKRYANQQHIKSTRVRWMDEQKEDEVKTYKHMEPQSTIHSMVSPTQGGCNLTEACMDAGIEVGCVPGPPPTTVTTTHMMDAKEAIAVAWAKSPRNSRKGTPDIVFDDDGNPIYKDSTKKSKRMNPKISLPDVPPPPNKKERFFPELCGVQINCGEDDAYVQKIPKYNFENSVNYAIDRCSNNMTDDDDELIMMMDELDNSVLEDNDESDSFASDVETLRNSINQVRDRNRELQEAKIRAKKSSRTSSHSEKGSKKKSMHEIVDHYMVKEESDDEQEEEENDHAADWEEKMSPTGSSANFFRRVWPRSQNNTKDISSIPTINDDNSDDGIPKNNPVAQRRTISRSRSPSRFRRGETTNVKPMVVQDVYESIELVNNDEKRSISSGIGAVLKSITAKSPRASIKKTLSSAPSIHETMTSDWDESFPIVHDIPKNDLSTAVNALGSIPIIPPSTSLPGQLPNPNSIQGISNQQAPSNLNPMTYLPQALSQNPPPMPPTDSMYPQMHPAHPLINNGTSGKVDQDDLMERQSFITAHRLGLDPVNIQKGQTIINDDILERQSFIGAYRQGMEEVVDTRRPGTLSSIPEGATSNNEAVPAIMQNTMPTRFHLPQGPTTRDDIMECQSYIPSYRQGYDPVQRPASAPLTHDDIMERMSYITASRERPDPSIVRGNVPSPPKQSRRERRSRSKSPRRGIEQQNTFQPNPMLHGMLYDHMGNPVYGHPAAYYHPAMLPMHRDPPTTAGPTQVAGSHDLYQGMGEHSTPYYVAQNWHMSNNNTPILNNVMPYSAHQYTEHQAINGGPPINEPSQNIEQVSSDNENEPPVVTEEDTNEPELTWEERTRQAWERIRGGISALTFESTTDPSKPDDKNVPKADTTAKDDVNPAPNQQQSDTAILSTAASNDTHPTQHPIHPVTHNMVQPHDLVKRVSFGEPQQLIYYDDQDENRSTMSLPCKSSKKKKQFRGSKLVGGVLGKVKNSLNKVTFARSTSSDTVASLSNAYPSHSQEWDGYVIRPNHSMSSISQSYHGQQNNPAYMYPANMNNATSLQNYHQTMQAADPRLMSSIPQQTYPHPMNPPSISHPNQVPYQPHPHHHANTHSVMTIPSHHSVLSNSNMYNVAPSQYPQQQYSMPMPLRNVRRSL